MGLSIQESSFSCMGDANDAILVFTHFLITWILKFCLQSQENVFFVQKERYAKMQFSDKIKD